ncbi:MAG: hypothetical protein EBZ77_08730 [Chitinophagia bacterium]|nr:hypothetical protein [Chitinophagia bacterium]
MVTTIVADGEEHDVAVQYNDFKKLASGVTVPASWVTPQGAVNFTNIEVNVPVDDAVFRP